MKIRAVNDAKLLKLGFAPPVTIKPKQKKIQSVLKDINGSPAGPRINRPKRTAAQRKDVTGEETRGKGGKKGKGGKAPRDGLLTDESDQEVIALPKRRAGFAEQEQLQRKRRFP
jgi:hypothetical protein